MKKPLQGQFRGEATFKLVNGTDFHVSSSQGTSLRSLESVDGNGPCPASGRQSTQQLISQLSRAGFKGLAGGFTLFAKQYVWLIHFLHHYSFMQSSALYEARTSKPFTTHNMEQPVAFCTEAVLEPGTCFNAAVLQPREAAGSTDASSQLDNFVLCSCGCFTFPDERLPTWQPPCSTRGVSGSVWTSSIEG